MEIITVLIVDDQTLFAESLKTFIHNYAEDIRVEGIARDGRQALALWEELRPSLVLMDVHMPVMNGVEAVRELMERRPDQKIIMLSTYDEDEYVRRALGYGASGYLLKDLSPPELIASIRAVHSGVSQISPCLVNRLVRGGLPEGPSPAAAEGLEGIEELTKREREIFGLIATGYDNDQIARELCIAERTVRNHVSLIYAKLGIRNRFQIIRLASRIPYPWGDPRQG